MKRPRVLIASSNREQVRLCRYLAEKSVHAEVLTAHSGPDAMRLAEAELPDVLVLDAALPGTDGYHVCRRLRAQVAFLDMPVVFLVDRPEGKYQAFQVGATDVMTCPLDQLEFQYRLKVHAKSRARHLESTPEVQAGELTLQPSAQTACLNGEEIALTPSEFSILVFLAAHAEQTVPTEALLVDALGEPRQLGNPQVVHTHIKNLRRKLEPDPSSPRLITSSRRGYTFHPPGA